MKVGIRWDGHADFFYSESFLGFQMPPLPTEGHAETSGIAQLSRIPGALEPGL